MGDISGLGDTQDWPDEAARVERTQAAIERLKVVLPVEAPELWASLNPPASDEEIAALERAIAPHPLPKEVEVWLRFANGQHADSHWWPTVGGGSFMSVAAMIEQHELIAGWPMQPKAWLRLTHSSHYMVAIELGQSSRPPLIIDACVSNAPSIVAPSFHGLLSSAADYYETDRSAMTEGDLLKLSREIFARQGWNHSPYAPDIELTEEEVLERWGE